MEERGNEKHSDIDSAAAQIEPVIAALLTAAILEARAGPEEDHFVDAATMSQLAAQALDVDPIDPAAAVVAVARSAAALLGLLTAKTGIDAISLMEGHDWELFPEQ